MNIRYLVWQSIRGRRFRSGLILMLVLLLSLSLFTVILVSKGLEAGLRTGLEKLGADIIAVTYAGLEPILTKGILVMPEPMEGAWIPRAQTVDRITVLEGVDKVSPQLYVQSLTSGGERFFIVAFDPETDFSIQPWLEEELDKPLGLWGVIGGYYASEATINDLNLASGRQFHLAGKLRYNETWTDWSLFLTLDAINEMMAEPGSQSIIPPDLPPDFISAVMVTVKHGYDIDRMRGEMIFNVPGVWPIGSLGVVRTLQTYRSALMQTLFIIAAVMIVLAVILIGLILSMMVTGRRREIGMLRAIGARHNFIFRLFMTEGTMLALSGGIIGVGLALGLVFAFKSWITATLGTTFIVPPWTTVLGLGAVCLLITILIALPAIMYPALRASRLDPAEVMREV